MAVPTAGAVVPDEVTVVAPGVPGLLVEDAYGPRPTWRGKLHLAAAALAVPAGVVLATQAAGLSARVAAVVYAASLVGLFAVSAAYHLVARTPRAVTWMRRADHSMIFVLIAGSYTPICLLVLPTSWGLPLLAAVWLTAVVGIVIKVRRLGPGEGSSASWLYIVMGWAGVLTLPGLVSTLAPRQLVLLGVGGMLYTVGAVVLARRWPDPRPHSFGYHEVWHGMTIIAGACHFVVMFELVG